MTDENKIPDDEQSNSGPGDKQQDAGKPVDRGRLPERQEGDPKVILDHLEKDQAQTEQNTESPGDLTLKDTFAEASSDAEKPPDIPEEKDAAGPSGESVEGLPLAEGAGTDASVPPAGEEMVPEDTPLRGGKEEEQLSGIKVIQIEEEPASVASPQGDDAQELITETMKRLDDLIDKINRERESASDSG